MSYFEKDKAKFSICTHLQSHGCIGSSSWEYAAYNPFNLDLMLDSITKDSIVGISTKEMVRPTRNNRWRGTKGHSKDKSRFYETWYKAIRNANTKYQKQYYDKREYEKFLSQLNGSY